jgi:Transcriptional regulator
MENKYQRESEKRILKAVNTIIEEEGFSKIGINRIARVAECNKVLIYRYFGGLEGLLTEWAKENDFYTTAFDRFYEEIKTVDKSQLRSLAKKILISQIHSLRENILMQELLIWELTGQSKFSFLQELREKNGSKLQKTLNEMFGFDSKEINHYMTVLIASINYIVLYTRKYPIFNDIDFSQPDSWKQYEKVIENYIDISLNTLNL